MPGGIRKPRPLLSALSTSLVGCRERPALPAAGYPFESGCSGVVVATCPGARGDRWQPASQAGWDPRGAESGWNQCPPINGEALTAHTGRGCSDLTQMDSPLPAKHGAHRGEYNGGTAPLSVQTRAVASGNKMRVPWATVAGTRSRRGRTGCEASTDEPSCQPPCAHQRGTTVAPPRRAAPDEYRVNRGYCDRGPRTTPQS